MPGLADITSNIGSLKKRILKLEQAVEFMRQILKEMREKDEVQDLPKQKSK